MLPKLFSPKIIITLLVLLIADVCWMPLLSVFSAHATLLYLMVLYAAFRWQGRQVIQMAFVVGLLRDLVSHQPLGVETAALVIFGMALKVIVQKIERQQTLIQMGVCFLFCFGTLMTSLLLSMMFQRHAPTVGLALAIAFLSAAYTSVMLPFVFVTLSHWYKDRVVLKQYDLFH